MPGKARVFLDTNVLVYQFDRSDPAKQKSARQLVERHLVDGSGVISSQVVQEFMNVALRKFATKLSSDELRLITEDLLKPLLAQLPSLEFYDRALDLYDGNSLGFYDSLIVQAAIDLGCSVLYSEDLQDGQLFGNLKIVNPFD